MSIKEFWEDDPELFWAFRFSYIQTKKQEQELNNNNMWLQGAYIYEAISVALSNAFSKTKSTYAKEPYSLSNSKEEIINKLQMQLKNRVMEVKKVFGDK